ncbi:hypothetical protein COU78_01740 [Candidatus Peregrinibacteria bacterium CG10_big_fil_rev_8_21_14_0_10_49_24]|nr:MAG: hypothetical protein COV83_00375 [Candidatus Peregrinibacteria bacterium CG11_big_fil_rev_8_21_14_0_20_49_14]PIR51444.1 MAG: hypothetical protein COU78_01740 [Candidatus Peregrinibacteria bacterium CG10_big_fil_rev_8_21_14_0_10_49_24]PJA67380.1 MAG: hypothetical protein CO157_04970 [Candidatus Peregrinibacteria bacterium CG_4_9_14_3_um_filter_49_12]
MLTIEDNCRRLADEYGEFSAFHPRVTSNPDASVVVPAFREEKQIVHTIETLIASVRSAADDSYHEPSIAEILFVDNDASAQDRTAQLIELCGIPLVEEHDPARKGVSYARHRGHVESKGGVILCTDADTRVPDTWVHAHMRHYKDSTVVGVTGDYDYDQVHWLYKAYTTARVPWRGLRWIGRKVRGLEKHVSFTGANMSYDKSAAEIFGGFELGSDKGEDTIMGEQLKQTGKVILDESPEITVLTSGRRFGTFQRAAPEITANIQGVLRRVFNIPVPRGKNFRDYRD